MGWTADSTLFVSIIDILHNTTGTRHSALEGHTASIACGLLVLVVVEGTRVLQVVNLDLDSQASSSSFHYTPWALHSDLVH